MHSLTKGNSVRMTKTPVIRVTCTWASSTDYEVHALVLYRNGNVEHIATFEAADVLSHMQTEDGAVRHLGDVGVTVGGGTSEEILEVRMSPAIQAVIPVAYSAQGNGAGSFYEYQVSTEISNGAGEVVRIPAIDASREHTVYSCVPGIIFNSSQGDVVLKSMELYSAPNSERRPAVALGPKVEKEKKKKSGFFGGLKGGSEEPDTDVEITIDGVTFVLDMNTGPKNRYKAKKVG